MLKNFPSAFLFVLLFVSLGLGFESPLDVSDPSRLPSFPLNALGWPNRSPQNLLEDFQKPPAGYGEVPFWWWSGDRLDKKRLEWQIEELHRKRISGVQVNYVHKDTPGWPSYRNDPAIFSPEWWDFYAHASHVAAKYNMGIGLSTYTLDWNNTDNLFNEIIYGDREINARALRGKQVRMVKPGESFTLESSENHIAFAAYPVENGRITGAGFRLCGDEVTGTFSVNEPERNSGTAQYAVWEFTYEVQAGTLNPLHPQSGQRIIEKFFQPFEDHNEGTSAGLNYFFNDELNVGYRGWQWTDDFAERFAEVKGYDFFSVAAGLFTDLGNQTPKARIDTMAVQVYLSELRYFKPIFMWHYSRGMIFGCDNNGRGYDPTQYHDYFSAIRWYTAPGHDTPGGQADFIKDKVSSSISNLYRRPRVWLEGYHSLGWGANPDGLMYATNENFVFGATLLNLHGLYYTTHGSRWEWAPPCYHFRMPYWKHMDVFLKYYERLSYLLSQGTWQAEVAIIYPVTPYWAGLSENQKEATATAFDLAKRIYATNRDIAFIDDQSIQRAQIVPQKGDTQAKLSVSGMNFVAVVIPSMEAVQWDTLVKLRQFQQAGGLVFIAGKKPVVSDRAGANDPMLDKLVNEILQTAQDRLGKVEAPKAPAEPEASPRVYPGGFTGYWAWSKEHTNRIQAVGTLKGLSDAPATYQVKFFCDNHGDLFVNDQKVCSNANYESGWTGTLPLKNGDKIRIDALDDDGGNRTAGIFFSVSDGKKTRFSTLDLRYRLEGNSEPKPLDPQNVHDLHRFGRKDVRTGGSSAAPEMDKRFVSLPRDIIAGSPIKYLHRKIGHYDVYMVMGAERDSVVSFRCTGQAERWDPMTGKVLPVRITEVKDGYTSVQIPVARNEACVFVFDGGRPAQVSEPVEPASWEVVPVEGTWSFKLLPTMNNQWGDFSLPVTADNMTIGAEARRFEYRRAGSEDWKPCSPGYGPRFWVKSVPLTSAPAANPVESLEKLDSSWTPYEFSWRWGIEGNPGHQGYHGLKENLNDGFIGLGVSQRGHNETLFVKENPPKRYFLTTTVRWKGTATIQKGGNLPDAVFLDGKPVPNDAKTVELSGETQVLTLSYPTAGRGFWFLEKGVHEPRQAQPEWDDLSREEKAKAFPNAMSCYTLDTVEFNAAPPASMEYRLDAPAGLDALTLILDQAVESVPRVFVDGKEFAVKPTEPKQFKTRRWVCSNIGAKKPSSVVIVLPDSPLEGGAAFAEPVLFSTKDGEIDTLCDWSSEGTGLQYYSGGAVYGKTVTVTKEQSQGKAVLSLGDLCATAEVRVNGKSAGVLVCQPWEIDLTGFLTEGENRIEVEIYSTLANHYRSIPTNYHGPTYKSGLIGPVELRFEKPAN